MPQPVHQHHKLSPSGLANLCVVYVVWSSTYLAIRVAVRPEGGFPPFIMGVYRMAVASMLLMLIAWLRRDRLKPTRDEFRGLLTTGVLLWVGGNGLLVWAEHTANSGFAALVVSSTPIWVVLFEMVFFRKNHGPWLLAAVTLGFAGLGVLLFPVLRRGDWADLSSGLALVCGAISWALGTIYQNRRPFHLSSTTTVAWQNVVACGGFLVASLLLGEPTPAPTMHAWMAWGYLVVFGTLATISFVTALKLLPINVTMTYAYVNPVLAVVLGWWVLGEPVTRWTLAGAALVIVSVVTIFRQRYHSHSH